MAGREPLRFLQRNEDSHTSPESCPMDCSDTSQGVGRLGVGGSMSQ
ncbi:hypothetical protein JOE21_003130 [Desmospora profundinema]|uniref:Uncharacterized protein n=1 Tax=Desmospora profundinema TaxID=1571184 RepID=A0ABU1IRR6_9BACL|nr:hypothetical protein [Desmospora profundinema]